jgi:AraC-like ligand binding domain
MKCVPRSWTKLLIQTDRAAERPMSVPRGEVKQEVRFSVAGDVGGIELLFANFWGFEVSNHIHEGYNISVSLHGGLVFDERGSKHTAPSGVISAVEPCEVHNARGIDHNWGFLNFIVPLEVAKSAAAEVSDSERLPGFAQRVIFDRQMARRLVRLHTRLEASQDHLARHSATFSRSPISSGAIPQCGRRPVVLRHGIPFSAPENCFKIPMRIVFRSVNCPLVLA